jgi:hypothetical protein
MRLFSLQSSALAASLLRCFVCFHFAAALDGIGLESIFSVAAHPQNDGTKKHDVYFSSRQLQDRPVVDFAAAVNISDVPSDSPSESDKFDDFIIDSSNFPSDPPSDVPTYASIGDIVSSNIPSDSPSDAPSDAPSFANVYPLSSIPSMFRSDFPSFAPSSDGSSQCM